MCRLLIVFALVAVPGHLIGQIPQRFENLQVLPRDIPRDSLLSLMRTFSFALNVRCVYCHVGEDNPTLAGVDFKSDDRPTKRTAREMLRMVESINRTISTLHNGHAHSDGGHLQVRCMTCHRGSRRPIMLEDTLYRVASVKGGAAMMEEYDSLRARHHGKAMFDFGVSSLVRLAEQLAADRKYEEAVLALRKNVEMFPRGWNSYYELGLSLEKLNRTDEAIAAYRAVLERLPNHNGSMNRLRALNERK